VSIFMQQEVIFYKLLLASILESTTKQKHNNGKE